MFKLDTELSNIRGIGEKFLKRLAKLEIKTIRDLLRHFPFRYEDFSRIVKIGDLQINQSATVRALVQKISMRHTWRRKLLIIEAILVDETGGIKAIWFNQPYIARILRAGMRANFAGKVTASDDGIYLSNPAYEVMRGTSETKHTAGLIPVYPETKGLTSKGIRFLTKPILNNLEKINDFIPPEILKKNDLFEINYALKQIHFPRTLNQAEQARKRFAFEDLFLLQLNNLKIRLKLAREKAPPLRVDEVWVNELTSKLPFDLTASQKRSLNEILGDLALGKPMNRLLQGDVGSGKTVVAAIAALVAARNNKQTAFMAPTEVLARQHYKTLTKIFGRMTVGMGLLIGGETRSFYGDGLESKRNRKDLLWEIANGKIKIIIGTHALISSSKGKRVMFNDLALAIVDEQHRFGVQQRATLVRFQTTNASESTNNDNDKIVEKELSYKLGGLFFKIQGEMGRFCRERQYADVLEKKLKEEQINFKREYPIEVGNRKSNFVDFAIEDRILIDLKAKPFVEKDDYYQMKRYLEISNLPLGLIVNFQDRYLKPKRVLSKRKLVDSAKFVVSNRLLPHFLSMSATPIPRTLSLTLFGDLDLSLIDELPEGRRPILTKIVAPHNRGKAYEFIREQIKKGRQAFIICPRIEPSRTDPAPEQSSDTGQGTDERQTNADEISARSAVRGVSVQSARSAAMWETKAVKEEYEKLSKQIFPDLRVAMLHGKMKSGEKEKTMSGFSAGQIDILVSTSVVEVGVDVPNASIMVIEGADRFGLAQLYQFRGRVGRGEHQSFSFLFTDSSSAQTQQRLRALLKAKNGFELAEQDLAIRGPGQFLGEKQTGLPDLAMRSLNNMALVKAAREAAVEITKEDPDFRKHPSLREKLASFQKEVHLE